MHFQRDENPCMLCFLKQNTTEYKEIKYSTTKIRMMLFLCLSFSDQEKGGGNPWLSLETIQFLCLQITNYTGITGKIFQDSSLFYWSWCFTAYDSVSQKLVYVTIIIIKDWSNSLWIQLNLRRENEPRERERGGDRCSFPWLRQFLSFSRHQCKRTGGGKERNKSEQLQSHT